MNTLIWIGAGVGAGTVLISGGLFLAAWAMFRAHRDLLADNHPNVADTLD